MSKKSKPSDGDIAKVVLDDLDRFEHFAVTNWKGIILASVLIVVFVAVFATTLSVRSSISAKASSTIASATTEAELEKVVSSHSGNPAANGARLKLASMLVGGKQYEKAMEQYKAVEASKTAPDDMRWRAKLNSCCLLEMTGKKSEAAEGFAEFGANTLIPELFRGEANYGAGRLFMETGKPDRAAEVLRMACSESGPMAGFTSFWAGQSKLMLEKLPATARAATKAAPAADGKN